MKRSCFGLLLYALTALAVGAPRLAAQADTVGNATTPLTVDPPRAQRGEKVWRKHKCGECHTFADWTLVGPSLRGVVERRSLAWLRQWLRETDRMLQTDSVAITLLATFGGVRMPTHPLSEREIEELMHYMVRESDRADSR